MARPKLDEGLAKTGRVELRVRPDKKDAWKHAAVEANTSLQAWAEATLDAAAAKSQRPKKQATNAVKVSKKGNA